ncbi:MAG: hypothetical protein SOV49_04570, partial [Erysipelotrichaceae bacterium]|nr:hypothetical protein [Erysipelotrichaceae bacterium]
KDIALKFASWISAEFELYKAYWKSEAYRKVMKDKSITRAWTVHHKPFPIPFGYETSITIFDMESPTNI